MHARVTRLRVPAYELDEDIALDEESARVVAETPGSLGFYYLVDRTTGNTMAITFWESEEALRASEEMASQRRAARTSPLSATVVSVERYEVVYPPSGMPGAVV